MVKLPKSPKFKLGDWVYSWRNPGQKAKVTRVYKELDAELGYPHKYKLSIVGPDGYQKVIGIVNETSLTKRRTKNWLRENCPRYKIKRC